MTAAVYLGSDPAGGLGNASLPFRASGARNGAKAMAAAFHAARCCHSSVLG